jgi:alanyl-tRNA synthetase
MTERLYYTDPYLVSFDAQVVQVGRFDGRPVAVLDRTAFYPTSGGQPHDTGTLDAARVVEVLDLADGTVGHVIDGELAAGPVRGTVDWARRFEHMQQHTGQHVLSAAFEHLGRVRTESFHLGAEGSTIDLAREVSPAEISAAELEANRIVWEDRPVSIRFVSAEDAAALPLRKEPVRGGTLRLIDVEGFDLSACGGTHVARTGAIGIIAISGWERFRGGTRVDFRCGVRALRGYRALRDAVSASVRLLTVHPSELPAAIERLVDDTKDARRRVKDLQSKTAVHEAAALAERAEERGASRVVVELIEDADAGVLKTIAGAIASRPGHVAILFSAPPGANLVVARAADVTLNAGEVLKAMTSKFGGKGGGRPEMAQGGGLDGSPAALRDFARSLL